MPAKAGIQFFQRLLDSRLRGNDVNQRFPKRQKGFSIITAIFLIVTLAALAAYAVNIGTQQQLSAVLAVNTARAYHAAESGLEWASYRAINGSCANKSFKLADEAAYPEDSQAGFRVEVICEKTTHQIRNVNVNYYQLSVTASLGTYGDPQYVSRRLRATVSDGS